MRWRSACGHSSAPPTSSCGMTTSTAGCCCRRPRPGASQCSSSASRRSARQLLEAVWRSDWSVIALKFFPFVLMFELPIQALVMLGAVRRYVEGRRTARYPLRFHPSVTCIITCYAEGADVQKTVRSLTEQLYDGPIEMLAVVDGAVQNRATLAALRALGPYVNARKLRRLEIVPKLQRGGRVSSLNQGLALACGEIVLALDGDTSFDNDMVRHTVRHFADSNVVAVAGNLRVRNA